MKTQKILDLLEKDKYHFWYELNNSEVWVNTQYTLVITEKNKCYQVVNKAATSEQIQSLL